MATRFYLTNSNFASITTDFSPEWEETSQAVRTHCWNYPTQSSGSLARTATHTTAAIADALIVQYISEPLDGYQFITGTCKGGANAIESAATAEARAQLVVKVVSNDGYVTRGYLVNENNSALSNEFSNASSFWRRYPLNRPITGFGVSPTAAQDGDRIVIEMGVRFHTTTTGVTATLTTQDIDSSGFLSDNEALALGGNPWFEFSQDFAFKRNSDLVFESYADGYQAVPEIQIQGNLANLCGSQETSAITFYVMRGTDVDCAGPAPTYRTWNVTGDPDTTGFYYFGTKCGPSPLADIIIVKELMI